MRPPKYRNQTEFVPHDQPADPVLAEAFGRPFPGAESLQRHPADAGALEAEKHKDGEEPDDPWRDPGAAAALGRPALTPPAPAPGLATATNSVYATCSSAERCPIGR
ncbi:putative SERINE PROTEASE HTRA domain protein [Mycobacterium xenopi 3993]|nr:putative SERINE PROTEASE HTRA domain protein [Mycobacterium xenopi 3993]